MPVKAETEVASAAFSFFCLGLRGSRLPFLLAIIPVLCRSADRPARVLASASDYRIEAWKISLVRQPLRRQAEPGLDAYEKAKP